MGYEGEDQEEYASFKNIESLHSKNIPREYSRWAYNFLTNKGINPNTVNLADYYDRSKSLQENRETLVSEFSEPRAEPQIEKKVYSHKYSRLPGAKQNYYEKQSRQISEKRAMEFEEPKENALSRLSRKAGELKYRFIDAPRERRLKERRFKVMSKKEELALMREEMAVKRQERQYAREMGKDAPRTSPLKSLTGPSKQILFGGKSDLLKRFESGGGDTILERFATGNQGRKEAPESNLLDKFNVGGQGASQSQNNSILKRLATSNKPKLDFSFKPGKRKLPKFL